MEEPLMLLQYHAHLSKQELPIELVFQGEESEAFWEHFVNG